MPVILGLDPGSRITGYGIIRRQGNAHSYVACGSIHLRDAAIEQRLRKIYLVLTEVIENLRPDEAAIEQVFLHQNPAAAIKLGQARGSAITAAAVQDLAVAEYSARQIKQAVVGYGNADKCQIQTMVCRLLNLKDKPQEDAADALAVALCHSFTSQGLKGIGTATKLSRGRLR